MPTLNGALDPAGALVRIRLGWSAAAVQAQRLALGPIPPPVELAAMIDCGADVSCVDTVAVQPLGLPIGGFTLVNLPALGGMDAATEHDVTLTILHPSGNAALDLVLTDQFVMEMSIGALGYQALIGRDVLDRCRFVYDGPASAFELTY